MTKILDSDLFFSCFIVEKEFGWRRKRGVTPSPLQSYFYYLNKWLIIVFL
jgi:hypothetical protein